MGREHILVHLAWYMATVQGEVVVLFAVGTSLLRLSTIASYSLRKIPRRLEFQ